MYACFLFAFCGPRSLEHRTVESDKRTVPNGKMPGKDYYKLKIDRMVQEALAQKEEEFVLAHKNDTDEELLQYFLDSVGGVGHTPRRKEFIGWTLIEERFGSVDNAARILNLPLYRGSRPISECRLISGERERQKKIYREKKLEKRRKSELRMIEQEKRREEELIWLAEHDPAKLLKKTRKTSKKRQKAEQLLRTRQPVGNIQFYLSTLADIVEETPDNKWEKLVYIDYTAPLVEANGLGVEIAEFCISENMDDKFDEVLPHVLKNVATTANRTLHAPHNELFPAAIEPLLVELAYKRYEQSLEYCRRFGASKMVVHANYVQELYWPEWFVSRTVDFWKRFLAEHDDDVVICLENVFEGNPDLILEVLRQVDDPRLKMCLDVGHANLTGIDPTDWLKTCAPYISHYHLHNNFGAKKEGNRISGDMHFALGNGNIDMEALLNLAGKLTPNATATVESYDQEDSVKWLKEKGFIGVIGDGSFV